MLNCVHYELPIDGFKIINKFRLEGIIIPSLVLKVLIVTKSSTFSGKDCVNFNADDSLPRYSEVRHSSVIVENNECVGIVAFDAIPPEDSLNLEKIATGIYISGGEVKRAPTKKGGKMVMVGWRTDFSRSGKMGNFGRYELFLKFVIKYFIYKTFYILIVFLFCYFADICMVQGILFQNAQFQKKKLKFLVII